MFGDNRSDMQAADSSKVSEIAADMNQNPSLRRISTVREAPIQAGVPSDKIQTGAFGETRLHARSPNRSAVQHEQVTGVGGEPLRVFDTEGLPSVGRHLTKVQ